MNRPSFPLYADLCGFNALLPKRTACAPAEGDVAADHVIVGAGFTGLAAARRLAELQPQARIVVIEATEVGEGSSGRNSGFASPRDLPSGPSAADLDRAEALNRFTEEGWAWLLEPIARHKIDCGLQRSGRIKAAATERGEAGPGFGSSGQGGGRATSAMGSQRAARTHRHKLLPMRGLH